MEIAPEIKLALESHRKQLEGLIKKHESATAELDQTKAKIEDYKRSLAALESSCSHDDEEGVNKIIKLREQIRLSEGTVQKIQQEVDSTIAQLKSSIPQAQVSTRKALAPELAKLKQEIVSLISPYFHHRNVPEKVASESDAVNDFNSFIFRSPMIDYLGAVGAAKNELGTINTILSGKNPWKFSKR